MFQAKYLNDSVPPPGSPLMMKPLIFISFIDFTRLNTEKPFGPSLEDRQIKALF